MTESRNYRRAALWVACALPLAAFASEHSVERKVAADATGEVVISNVAGTIDVRGWDRNEVQVTGTLDRKGRVTRLKATEVALVRGPRPAPDP